MCHDLKICILGHPQTQVGPLPPKGSRGTYSQSLNHMVRVSKSSKIAYCTWFIFALLHGSKESEGDPKCIFFTPNTNQGTFINDIL